MWARIPAPLHSSGGQAVNGVNLAIRFFVVELGALAAAAYWGWEATPGPGRWYLAVLAPAVVIVIWALFVSPKARIHVSKQGCARHRAGHARAGRGGPRRRGARLARHRLRHRRGGERPVNYAFKL